MIRKWKTFFALCVLCTFVLPLSGDNPREPKKVSDLMKNKLENAQKVLEGIAKNDFDKIAKSADDLMLISKKAEFQAIKTPRYEVHMNEFRRAAEGLIDNAKTKNLDGAALSYVEMTLSCVKCHKYVRDVRMARLEER
jgi:hypothetical protein